MEKLEEKIKLLEEENAVLKSELPKFKSKYDKRTYNPDKLCQKGQKSLTKQSDKDGCDVNKIIARAMKTGELPIKAQPDLYRDYSNLLDYNEALNIVIKAGEQFNSLPAEVRDRFNNNPEELLAFMGDSSNLEEAVSLGLAEKKSLKSIPETEGAGEAVPEVKGEAALQKSINELNEKIKDMK